METPVLVWGRGCADLIRIAPWRGLDSGSVSCCCFSASTAAYSTRLCQEVCTTEEWEDEGRIRANAKRQHLKPVRTPVAILGSLGVCIYVPASRHWLISFSPIHLT